MVVSGAAVELGKTGISSPGADTLLIETAGAHPLILTLITFDRNGTVQSAEPDRAKALTGQTSPARRM